jgi:hypothetical protein
MSRTFIRQDAQIASTIHSAVGFLDNITPSEANYQTNATDIAYDLNAIRSQVNNLLNRSGASFPTDKWYEDLVAPSALEAGSQRGVDAVNAALHLVEKKRVLRDVTRVGVDVTVGTGNNFVILGTGELPSNTTAAVGSVATLGTVVAFHAGTFGTHGLDEVAGPNALSPKNLMAIVDGDTGDPILSGGRVVWGLLQSETATDGHTISDTTPTRVQISFVRANSTYDDLEAVPFADIEDKVVMYATRERVRLEDLTEADFLRGAVVDIPVGSTVTRQVAYDNQGTTPVEQTANATLDLNSAGIYWSIRDLLDADLLKITEGSTGGTTEIQIGAAVDSFNVDAIDVDFASGVSIRSGGTRPIDIGVNDGVIESTAGALEIQAVTTLSFDDGNKDVSWSLAEGIHLSDAAQEWIDFETNFGGEVSLLNAINQAYSKQKRTKVQAKLTANVTAAANVNGPSYANNTDVDLVPFDDVPTGFVADMEIYLNGELLRNALDTSEDVYPGTSASQGDLKFTFNLLGIGAKPDQLTVIRNG